MTKIPKFISKKTNEEKKTESGKESNIFLTSLVLPILVAFLTTVPTSILTNIISAKIDNSDTLVNFEFYHGKKDDNKIINGTKENFEYFYEEQWRKFDYKDGKYVIDRIPRKIKSLRIRSSKSHYIEESHKIEGHKGGGIQIILTPNNFDYNIKLKINNKKIYPLKGTITNLSTGIKLYENIDITNDNIKLPQQPYKSEIFFYFISNENYYDVTKDRILDSDNKDIDLDIIDFKPVMITYKIRVTIETENNGIYVKFDNKEKFGPSKDGIIDNIEIEREKEKTSTKIDFLYNDEIQDSDIKSLIFNKVKDKKTIEQTLSVTYVREKSKK
ncbi:MAG: hypothetical protein A2Y34_02580 [Spirochaetes bacterium GWC1_27_15]|nr:MAG: hypothetical protein A2Z98_15490 [Spirochaetes bacterium GWB1_27_13]OHD28048.1 MAG: hypothetical protein A2Y34_02580 [Spirochaetes bacterium GWC1_27_15]